MKIVKSVRVSEELCEVIQELTKIYKENYVKAVTSTNIVEKLVISGIPTYIEYIKERESINPSPNVTIAKQLQNIEKKLMVCNEKETKLKKVINFRTEEKLHQCIEELAQIEAKVLAHSINYNTMVNGMMLKGADFYIDLIENYIPYEEIEKIIEIRKYIHSLDLRINSLLDQEQEDDVDLDTEILKNLVKGKAKQKVKIERNAGGMEEIGIKSIKNGR